jgi:hypothetical protein
MVRRAVSIGLAVAAVLVVGALLGRAPILPAAAQEARTRQVLSSEDAFSFSAVVPPGGVVAFERPPAGTLFLVKDVIVQNLPIGGSLANTESLSLADKSIVTVGPETRQAIYVDRRRLGGVLTLRVSGRDLEKIQLESGFVPADRSLDVGDRLVASNSADATAAAFVQIYGQLIPITP